MSTNKSPLISVVIPAFNEEKNIYECLKSIENQNLPREDYEIIVVDNNSTDKTTQLIRQNFPKVKIIKEGKQGVVFARIAGVKAAKANIVSFTDADSIAPSYWLTNIHRAFQNNSVVAVGAITDLQPKNTLVDIIEPVINRINPALKIMAGFNLSFKKDAYNKTGGFSPKINLAEDCYLSWKIKKAGKVVILKNNAVISSSRRYQSKTFLPYAAKYVLNALTISLFDKTLFFGFRPIRSEKKLANREFVMNILKRFYRS